MNSLTLVPLHGIPEVRAGDVARHLHRRRRRRPGHAAAARRLRRRHPEGRVEGRGPAWSRSIPTTATPRRRARRIGVGAGAAPPRRLAHRRDQARVRVRGRGDRHLQHRRGLRRAAPRRRRQVGEADPRRPPRDARRRSRRGDLRHLRARVAARARPTSPSACPGSRRCSTSAASTDTQGRELLVTEIAIADEIAGAAELVMGKSAGVPVADRARPRSRVVPRELGARADPRARRRHVPLSRGLTRSRVHRGAAIDPRVPPGAGAA